MKRKRPTRDIRPWSSTPIATVMMPTTVQEAAFKVAYATMEYQLNNPQPSFARLMLKHTKVTT